VVLEVRPRVVCLSVCLLCMYVCMYVWVNSCTLLCLDQPVYLYLCTCTCVPVPVCAFFLKIVHPRARDRAPRRGTRGSDQISFAPSLARLSVSLFSFVSPLSSVRVSVSVCPCVSIGTTERRVQDDDDDDDDGVTDEAGVGAVDTGIVTAGWDSRVIVIVVVVVVDARGRERTRGETKSGARAPTRRRRRTKGAARAEKDARGES